MTLNPTTPAATHSPRRLFPLPLQNVEVTDGFWQPRLKTLRTTTINDVFDKFERDGAFANFDRVAQGLTGGHRGFPWFDGLVYESLRAASDFLAAAPDAALEARLDGFIERIAAAQAADPDGYINTFVALMRPTQRWGAGGSDQLWTHEEYDAGCLVEAGVHHYHATGKTSLLALAVRFANYLCAYIGPAPRHNVVPSHSLPEEALIKLYCLLREEPALAGKLAVDAPQQFLDLARFWIEQRGNHQGRVSFSEYAQDHRSLFEQDEAVGHSVRATLLYTGLARLAAETGEAKYYAAARRLWQDVVERKMFITGGVGPIKEYEGFGYGYYLPDQGYIETCAGVGLGFWASQMNQAFGGGEYMDVYERVAYNNVLAGVSLNGVCYSYENPLRSQGALHLWDWHACPCCPPMLLKLFAEMPGLIYAQDGRDIFVNLYIGSRARITLPGGDIEIAMQTNYPWDGAVRLTLNPGLSNATPPPGDEQAAPQENGESGLHLRLPAWCESFTVKVNGEAQAIQPANGYLALRRPWQAGDVVELELAMPAQRMISHPYVQATRERTALQRGPLIYCLEGVDNPAFEPTLPAAAQIQADYRPDLLDGVVILRTQDAAGSDLLAIPYYAWDNRPLERDRSRSQDASPAGDWLLVWLKQEDWFHLRQAVDGDDLQSWRGSLYKPLQ